VTSLSRQLIALLLTTENEETHQHIHLKCKNKTQKRAIAKTDKTVKSWFSHLLRHQVRRQCRPVLTTSQPIVVKSEYYQNYSVLGCVTQCYSQQHIHMSSSYRSSRLGLSHWDPYVMHRGGCLELYYCNMVEWSWWDSGLIC